MFGRRSAAVLGSLCMAISVSETANAQTVRDLESDGGRTPDEIANMLIGGGVTISNVRYTGHPRALGMFTGGEASVGFDTGIVLSSGKVQTREGDVPCSAGVEGPNTCFEAGPPGFPATATNFATPGDAQLDALAGFPTLDASVLEFDFVPQFATIQFRYVFGSEEYNDFVNTPFNDVFAFYVNGENCALVPDTLDPVSVNTINNGNPFADPTPSHPEFFLDNVRPEPTLATEMDGITTLLTCDAVVTPGQVNHMKLAIADASDGFLDSAVFINAGSFVSGTSISTQLVAGEQAGAAIEVPAGAGVVDTSELMGVNAATATGTVTYTVYSDDACTNVFADGGTVSVAAGVVPASSPVVFDEPGTYYWVADYSGDAVNNPSAAPCGSETVTVMALPAPPAPRDCKLWYKGIAKSAHGKPAKVKGFAWGREGKLFGSHEYWSLARGHGVRVKAIHSERLDCSAGEAVLEGFAWLDLQAVRYRIDLTDGSEWGGADSYRLRLSNGFDSGIRRLRFGHVVIREFDGSHTSHD